MSELSKQALKVQNNTEFPNNNAGLITPSKLRGFNTDMIDSLVDEISYNVDSASWNQQIDSLEGFTASLATNFVSTASFNAYTASTNSSITQLNTATASLFNSASLSLTTASFNNGTRNLTFNKGDGTTFAVNIPDVSGSAGNFVTTSSFNSYTASTDSSISQLNASSASQQISINALNANSASANSSITNLNSATASLFTSASLGLTTASFASQTLTFTKGDGSTFGIVIPDVSGSTINTGSFATTGSNTFNGNQTVNGGISGSGLQIHSEVNLGSTAYLRFESGSGGSDYYNIQLVPGDGSMAFSRNGASNVKVLTLAGSAGQKTVFQNNEVQFSSNVPQVTFDAPIAIGTSIVTPVLITGSITTTGYANIGGALSASLPQGYVWVGDATNRTAVVPTSSFGSTLPSGVISGSQQITALGFVSSSITASSLVTASVAVNVITFTKGDSSTFDITVAASGSVTPGTISGSQQITDLGFVSSSVTASSLVTASFSGNTLTFTKGDASTFGVVIPDVSGSGTAFANPSLESISGSLLITANTFTSGAANLLHISASAQNQANLVFKNNNNTGTTIVSGSNNIYVNPTTPTAGRINYIGGTSNLYLNGQGQNLPQITASAASVSGARPTMNSNYIGGPQAWTINQASNPGIHSYSHNMFTGTGTMTFNMLGNTGAVTFSSNLGLSPTMTINAPSASIANVLAGISGSNPLTITNNTIAGTFNYNGPVSSSGYSITQNNIAGTLTMNVQSQSRAVSFTGNIINGALTVNDNTNFSPTLGSTPSISNNNINGTITLTNRASASLNLTANNLNGFTISNDYDSSTNGTVGRTFALQGNALFGFIGNNIYFSGSANGTGTANDRGRGLYGNLMGGSRISASVIGDGNKSLLASAIFGQGLNVYGTSPYDASNAALAGGQNGGSAFFGRWNAEDGNRANSSETVFAVGTGNSGSAGITRKTGFLIDSGSNTFIEGTLNVSGSTSLNGNLILTGSLTASLGQGLMYVGNASGLTSTISTASLAVENALTSSITRNVVVVARNGGASTLPAGTVVHITSAVGDNPVFTTASYDTEALSSNTFGLLRYSSVSGADVEVVVNGIVTGVNTDPALGYAAGDILYLSSSGQFTKVQPQAPNQIVALGQVLRAQQNNGSVYVSINNGWELDELHNVQITSPQTNNLLVYESASYGLWKNKTISQVGLATTGSNTFVGTNSFSGAVSFTGSAPAIQSSSFSGSLITNLTDTYTDVSAVNQIVTLTSASYAALVTGSLTNPNTLYIVSGSTQVNPTFPYTGSAVITGSLVLTGSAQGNVVSASISSNTASIDFNLANYFEVTSSVTPLHLNVTNIKPGTTSTLIISASASSSITFSPNVAQPSGSAYSGSLGSIDILSLVAFSTSKVNVVSTKALV